MADKCPDCNGAGQYSLPEAAWRPGDDGWYKCERCGGSGIMNDKITVKFETTRKGMIGLLTEPDVCPGHFIPGETLPGEPGCDTDGYDCSNCYQAFISRIEVKDER
jgi:hypothetical protein